MNKAGRKFRVIEQTVQPRRWYDWLGFGSPIVRKPYRIEFADRFEQYGRTGYTHWQPHQGAGEFDTAQCAIDWVNAAIEQIDVEPTVIYERTAL